MSRILIIDDEPQIRKMLQDLFEEEGYDVLTAEDGELGLRLYRQQSIDLIITDLIMPEKEGIEVIREIRKDNPDTKIIAISGGGRIGPQSYLTFAQKFGAQFVFKKPVESNELLNAVSILLS
jgi:CheY-like chemotaxis protein